MHISVPIGNGKSLKISLKKLFFPFLIFLIIIIVLLKFSELKEIGRLFSQVKWYWLVLAFMSQVVNLGLQAGVYKKVFKVLKFPHINFFKLMKITLVMIFLDFTIPSYGVAGNIYLMKALTKRGFKQGKVLMMIILQLIVYYLALISLIITTLVYFFVKTNSIGAFQIVIAGGFIILFCFMVFMVRFWLGNPKKAPKRVAWFSKKFYKSEDDNTKKEVNKMLDEFYEDVNWIKKNKRKVVKPVLIQFAKFLSDGLTVFLIFLAFGQLVTYGVSLATFAFGKLFGLISFVPGGFGFIETAMTLTSNSLGLTLELSITTMLIYRFFSYWLYFPFGLIFYKHFSKQDEKIMDEK